MRLYVYSKHQLVGIVSPLFACGMQLMAAMDVQGGECVYEDLGDAIAYLQAEAQTQIPGNPYNVIPYFDDEDHLETEIEATAEAFAEEGC